MIEITQPFINILDTDGTPLQNGSLYFGVSGQNPIANPQVVYWDSAGTIPASQPISTLNGYPVRDGTVSVIYIGVSSYSFAIYNKKNILIYYKEAVTFTGPLATTTTDGWMSAADKVALAGKVDLATATAELGLGTAAFQPASSLVPAGSIMAFGALIAPAGWLICDGSAVSRTTYATLYSVISVTFGAGDTTTTFNLPDLRGEFLRGVDQGRGVDTGRTIGTTQADDFKSHTHQQQVSVTPTGGTTTGVTGAVNATGQGGSYVYTLPTGDSETRPTNVAIQYIIKT